MADLEAETVLRRLSSSFDNVRLNKNDIPSPECTLLCQKEGGGQCFSLSTWVKMNGARQCDPIALGWELAEMHFPPRLPPMPEILFCVRSAGPFLRSQPVQLPNVS